jgi:hypothetical protein
MVLFAVAIPSERSPGGKVSPRSLLAPLRRPDRPHELLGVLRLVLAAFTFDNIRDPGHQGRPIAAPYRDAPPKGADRPNRFDAKAVRSRVGFPPKTFPAVRRLIQ